MYDDRRSTRRTLERLKKLRELEAPRLLVRNEQIFLWALRRLRLDGLMCAPIELPGWNENYRKFVAIHEADVDKNRRMH